MKVNEDTILIGVALLVVGYIAYRGFGGAAKDLSKAAVNVASGVVEGTVVGAGQAFNIPETSKNACDSSIASGSYWDASFNCPAKRYAQFLITGK